MPQIELAPGIADDIARILEHLAKYEVTDAPARVQEIINAIQILESSPSMGRLVTGGKRELVIGQGARGYLALYRYLPALDKVFMLALRSQREAGYK